VNRLQRRLPLVALGCQREIDHHDRIFLHDADQQDDADQRHQAQIVVEHHQHQQCTNAGRRQRRQDGDRMDEALVQHAQHDVDHQNSRRDQ
jgi:hypothetical protein